MACLPYMCYISASCVYIPAACRSQKTLRPRTWSSGSAGSHACVLVLWGVSMHACMYVYVCMYIGAR